MKRVIVESPLKGDFERNIRYARWCCYDSAMQGEAPYASHLFCTQFMNDKDVHQRRLGMNIGQAWYDSADVVAIYLDLGESVGMNAGVRAASLETRCWVEKRKLPDWMMSLFESGENPPHTKGIY